MRIIILGGSGKIGRLAHRYLRAAYPEAEIQSTSRMPPANTPEWIPFDPLEDDWQTLRTCDVLINCIGAIRGKANDFQRVHLHLIERLKENYPSLGQPHVVQISALGADANHTVPFLATKGQADELLMQFVNSAVIVRPSVVCTPGTVVAQKFRTLIHSSRFALGKIMVPKGFPDTRIQPILPDDLGELLVQAVKNPSRKVIVDAVGPEPMNFAQLLQTMQTHHKSVARTLELPREMLDGFVKYFMSVWFPSVINYDQFRLLFLDNVGDPTLLTEWIGHAPASTLEFWKREGKP